MTPFEQAAAVYDREPCARNFEQDLLLHLQFGYVVSTPEAFAMVRRVRHDWPDERLREPCATAADGDCWFVWLLAGDLALTTRWLPCELPWLGYERNNRVIVRRVDKLISLATR